MNHKLKIILLVVLFPFSLVAQIDSVQSIQKINNLRGDLIGNPLGGIDQFGIGLEVIGDVDHDGIDDVAIGANKDDDGVTDQGAVYILMLNADGTVKGQQKISSTAGGWSDDFESYHLHFGSDIAALGDLNGDGNVDIAVGMLSGGDIGVSGAFGAIYVLFLDSDGTVLEYQKISDNQGGGNNILVAGDWFGAKVQNIGDINGDGLPDLAVGATGSNDGGTDRGAVFIINLDYNGTAKNIQKISDTAGGFTGVLNDSDLFGSGLAGLGDVDGDGVIDIAVGARFDDDGGSNRGCVWILFMNADGTVKSHQKISDTDGGLTGVLSNGDQFGDGLENIGDVDGNGINDIAIGASFDDDGTTNGGAIWILYLDADGTVKNENKISATDTQLASEITNGDRFSKAISCFGDRNNDGKIDLLIGAFAASDSVTTATGETYILHLDGTETYPHKKYSTVRTPIADVEKYSAATTPLSTLLSANDYYGIASCGIGDIDGDGTNDIVVGAHGDGSKNKGAVYIHFLNADGTIKGTQKISSTQGGFTGTLDNFDTFGISVCHLGEIGGYTNIVVGASGDDDGGGQQGAVWILALDTDGTVYSHQKISETVGGFTSGLSHFDYFGMSVANAGDLDGNGINDLAVGAYGDDDGGSDAGAVWILFLDTNRTIISKQKISDTDGNLTDTINGGDRFFNVGSVGDLDDDGVPDIVVGANGDDEVGTNAGAIYILNLTSSGTVKSSQKITTNKGGFTGVLDDADSFGVTVAGGSDFDSDGIDDVLVGSSGADYAGTNRGAVWLLFMNSDGTVKEYQLIGSSSNLLTGLIDDLDYFGRSIGIVDADYNTAKIVLGATGEDDGATSSGGAYLLELDLKSFIKKGASFIKPKVKLDAGYYNIPSNNKVRIQFTEEYYASGDLNFTVYDSSNEVETTTQSFAAHIGDGRYMIDIDSFTGITTGYYTLKITNSKNENRFLRLKKQ